MINEHTILPDNINDEAQEYINILNTPGGWSEAKKIVQQQLLQLLEKDKYISFISNYKRYLVSTVGASYLYDVPLYKRGHLARFAGKRVRVICIKSGRHTDRTYMAGIVGVTPPELLIQKLIRKYSFPAYTENLPRIYESPRFRLVEISEKLSLLNEYRRGESVEMKGWEALLLDGKLGKPIAIFRSGADGAVIAKHLRWHSSVTHNYESIRAAIEEIAL